MPERLWTIVATFWSPVEGMATLSGKTPEEAVEKAKELFKNEKDVTIVDVYEAPQQELFVLNDNGDVN